MGMYPKILYWSILLFGIIKTNRVPTRNRRSADSGEDELEYPTAEDIIRMCEDLENKKGEVIVIKTDKGSNPFCYFEDTEATKESNRLVSGGWIRDEKYTFHVELARDICEYHSEATLPILRDEEKAEWLIEHMKSKKYHVALDIVRYGDKYVWMDGTAVNWLVLPYLKDRTSKYSEREEQFSYMTIKKDDKGKSWEWRAHDAKDDPKGGVAVVCMLEYPKPEPLQAYLLPIPSLITLASIAMILFKYSDRW